MLEAALRALHDLTGDGDAGETVRAFAEALGGTEAPPVDVRTALLAVACVADQAAPGELPTALELAGTLNGATDLLALLPDAGGEARRVVAAALAAGLRLADPSRDAALLERILREDFPAAPAAPVVQAVNGRTNTFMALALLACVAAGLGHLGALAHQLSNTLAGATP